MNILDIFEKWKFMWIIPEVKKLSKRKLWNRFSKFHWDYTITSYFVNF